MTYNFAIMYVLERVSGRPCGKTKHNPTQDGLFFSEKKNKKRIFLERGEKNYKVTVSEFIYSPFYIKLFLFKTLYE